MILEPIEKDIVGLAQRIARTSRENGCPLVSFVIRIHPSAEVLNGSKMHGQLVFEDTEMISTDWSLNFDSVYADLLRLFTEACETWGWEWDGA